MSIVAHGSTIEITPIEVIETRFPMLHHECSLREGSGGPGKNRGGLGVRRIVEMRSDTTASALSDRRTVGPWGLFGGEEGGRQAFMIKRAGDSEFRTFSEALGTMSPTKFDNVQMKNGDVLLLEAPGGGEYGRPLERESVRVLVDVIDRNVSPDGAHEPTAAGRP